MADNQAACVHDKVSFHNMKQLQTQTHSQRRMSRFYIYMKKNSNGGPESFVSSFNLKAEHQTSMAGRLTCFASNRYSRGLRNRLRPWQGDGIAVILKVGAAVKINCTEGIAAAHFAERP